MSLIRVQNLTASSFAVPPPVARVLRAGGSCEVELTEAQLGDASLRRAEASGLISLVHVVDFSTTEDGVTKEDIFVVSSIPAEEIESLVPGTGINDFDYTKVIFERVVKPNTQAIVDLTVTGHLNIVPRAGLINEYPDSDTSYMRYRGVISVDNDGNATESTTTVESSINGADISATVVYGGGGITVNGSGQYLGTEVVIPAVGLVTCVAGSLISQGEKITIQDSVHPAVDFVFDKNASVVETGTTRRVIITSLDTSAEVATALAASVAAASATLSVYANQVFDGANNTVALQNSVTAAAAAGNIPITSTVANTGFSVDGMAGGDATTTGLIAAVKFVVHGTIITVTDMKQAARKFFLP